ncbi:MAG: hypothetical protein R2749_14395 [Acidimicrobiales bacterium]
MRRSATTTSDLPGLDRFTGDVLHTGRWPKEPVDLGRRVAVLARPAGVQAIPVIAEAAEHLHRAEHPHLFRPTTSRCGPTWQDAYKQHYDEVLKQRHSVNGFSGWSPVQAAPAALVLPVPGPAGRCFKEPQRRGATRGVERYGFRTFDRFRDVYKDMGAANELPASCTATTSAP